MPAASENVPPFAGWTTFPVEEMPIVRELPISPFVLAPSGFWVIPTSVAITLNVMPIRIAHRTRLALTRFAKILARLRILVTRRPNVGLSITKLIALARLDLREGKDLEAHAKRPKSFVDQIAIVLAKLLV